jgi:hypothetical protein
MKSADAVVELVCRAEGRTVKAPKRLSDQGFSTWGLQDVTDPSRSFPKPTPPSCRASRRVENKQKHRSAPAYQLRNGSASQRIDRSWGASKAPSADRARPRFASSRMGASTHKRRGPCLAPTGRADLTRAAFHWIMLQAGRVVLRCVMASLPPLPRHLAEIAERVRGHVCTELLRAGRRGLDGC